MFKHTLCLIVLTITLVGCSNTSEQTPTRRGAGQPHEQSQSEANQSMMPPRAELNIDEVQGSGIEGAITIVVSGTPNAIVETEGTSVQLDAQGKGKIALPFDTSPDNPENSFEFIANADGYESSYKYKVVVENLLYDAEYAESDSLDAEEKRMEREEQQKQRELAEIKRIKDLLRPKFDRLNQYNNEWLSLYQQYGVPDAGTYGIERSMRIAMQYGNINGKIQSVHDPIQEKWYSMPASEEETFEGKAYEALWNYSFALVTRTPHTYKRHRQEIQNYKQAVSVLLN